MSRLQVDLRKKTSVDSTPQIYLDLSLLDIVLVVILIFATIILNWRMIRDGLNGMTDMRWHIAWLQHFSQQLREGILYPQWLAGTNYGYGSPTFVFYPPLVYYLGSLIKFSGFKIESTLIILYSLSLFLAGFNFYLFGRSRWGKIAALIGACAYMSAPYIAYNLYWVSSLSVAYAIALIPLGWWLTDLALVRPRWKIAIAIFWAIFALTHLPNLLLCGLVWFCYTLFFLYDYSWKNVFSIFLFAGIGLGVASFFLIPAIMEQPLVNIASMKNVIGDITNGIFGAGLPFIPKKFDFQVSHIFFHQTLVFLILTAIALLYCRRDRQTFAESKRWIFLTLASAIMMSPLSIPIWQASETLQKIQAPWRLFSIYSFGSAALCAVTLSQISRIRVSFGKIFWSSIVVAILVVNASYGYKLARKFPTFRNPGQANLQHLEPSKLALEEPFSDKLIDVEEYRPVIEQGIPAADPILGQPQVTVVEGKAQIELQQWKSYRRNFQITAEQRSTIGIRTYYYPAWHLYLDNKSYPIEVQGNGTISFTVPPGNYSVELAYRQTTASILGKIVSLISIASLILFNLNLNKKLPLKPQPINTY